MSTQPEKITQKSISAPESEQLQDHFPAAGTVLNPLLKKHSSLLLSIGGVLGCVGVLVCGRCLAYSWAVSAQPCIGLAEIPGSEPAGLYAGNAW